jgi:hypothetical protein
MLSGISKVEGIRKRTRKLQSGQLILDLPRNKGSKNHKNNSVRINSPGGGLAK